MALVQGEDSESDEEINTEELHSLAFTPDGSLTGYRGLIKGASSQQKTAGIVMGEESETDEEEDEGHVDETDGGPKGEQERRPQKASHTAPHDTSRETSVEPILSTPQSLLHKKLRERNQSLRRNMVDRIIKLYRITCRNLTLVNNNLSKAQGTIETVNSNLKRSEHELSELNTIINDINTDARFVAPNLSIHVSPGAKKSPTPMRQRLLKGLPQVKNILGVGSKAPTLKAETKGVTEHQDYTQGQLKVPKLHTEGQTKECVEDQGEN